MVHYTTWAALAGLIALQLHYHYTLHITRPHYTRRNANTLGMLANPRLQLVTRWFCCYVRACTWYLHDVHVENAFYFMWMCWYVDVHVLSQ